MFRIIAPMAGWPGGTSGNSFCMRGRVSLAMMTSMPPASATFIRPRNKAITPTKPIASVTDASAVSTMAKASSSIGDFASPPGGSHMTCRTPATPNAMRTMTKNMPFTVDAPSSPCIRYDLFSRSSKIRGEGIAGKFFTLKDDAWLQAVSIPLRCRSSRKRVKDPEDMAARWKGSVWQTCGYS